LFELILIADEKLIIFLVESFFFLGHFCKGRKYGFAHVPIVVRLVRNYSEVILSLITKQRTFNGINIGDV
jgi:hypothetical protein